MIVTVFRTRLRPESIAAYLEAIPKIAAIAISMPGYISHKAFVAEDGERVTLVEFESKDALHAWSTHSDHVTAKKKGRSDFYSEYKVQICEVIRERQFKSA